MGKHIHYTKTYLALEIISLIITIAGLVTTVIVFPNWETNADITVSFSKNTSEKITSFYDVNNDSLRVFQTKGNSSCKYTIYYQARNQSGYDMIVRDLAFSENDSWNEETYSLSAHWWRDVRFKVKKTSGLNTASAITLSIGEEN